MKQFASVFLAFSLILTTSAFFAPSKSEAVVGLIMHKRVMRNIGGLSTVGGWVYTSAVLAQAATYSAPTFMHLFAYSIGAAVAASLGIFVTGVGLVLLDGKEIADFEFQPLQSLEGATRGEIAVYNDELDLLNSIRQTVQEEITDEEGSGESLWRQFGETLSPETMKVAALVAAGVMKNVRVVK